MSLPKKNRQKQETFLFVLMGLILLGLIISGYFLFVDKILPGLSSSGARPRTTLGNDDGSSAPLAAKESVPLVAPSGDGVLPDMEGQVITLYFPSRREAKLVREVRKVQAEKLLLSQGERLVRELLRGPFTPEARTCIPSGTQLRALFFHQGVFYVDFTREFLENAPGGVLDEALAVYSVVNTLTELDRKARVRILVNGGEVETIKGHVALNAHLTRFEPLISATN
ncbi:MAG: Spore germination protein [Candidatus Ozemobacter sibiricus]|uniref:Spore germination protein n=1 Tax=Candidatus Ozemobacter sibiricus TaxID=2268124 RepID=A0A367ZIN5_9BACT|nr:MAG: Spore germination protein [Candidatus Ozemobacter sibiricus]